MARVLGGDQIGAGEHGKRAERDVGEIADRRRHEIEAWRQAAAPITSASTRFGALTAAGAMRPRDLAARPARMRLCSERAGELLKAAGAALSEDVT